MDTKLKNRRRLGIILLFLTALLCAAVTLAAFPYMEGRARAYAAGSREDEQRETENMAPRVMNCVYSLWMEEAEKLAGHRMTPSQVFLPALQQKIEEERVDVLGLSSAENPESGGESAAAAVEESDFDLREVQSSMDRLGRDWKADYQSLLSSMVYTMYGQEGNILQNSAGRTLPGQADGYVDVRLSFDHLGRMTVEEVKGSEEWKNDVLANALLQYEYEDPLGGIDSGLAYLGVPFEGPKNVKYSFRFDGSLLGRPAADFDAYDLMWSGCLYAVLLPLMALAVLAALLLPCFKTLGIADRRIFKAPLEIVALAGIFWAGAAFSEFSALAAAAGMDGSLAKTLSEFGIAPAAAANGALFIEGVFWWTLYAVLIWMAVCLWGVFHLGLFRYIKERTVIGSIVSWMARWWRRLWDEAKNVDWRDPSTKIIRKIVICNFAVISVFTCLWFMGIFGVIIYSVGLFFLLRKYWREMQGKYRILLEAINEIADGNLDVEIRENLGIFEPFRSQIDKIRQGFKKAVDEEVKSRSMKTELITNVSHDLKTPLTAIITYVNLLKDENITPEERSSYIEILDQKSMRLKALIEDLFEVSKANSRSVTLNLVDLDVVSLMKQVRLELDDRLRDSEVEFKWNFPAEPVIFRLDSEKTYRIFENLLVNIAKYGMPGSRAYIDMKEENGRVVISMKNISAQEISGNGMDMTERFVRGDRSRNTEGSGLGLAIARSFTEIQKGRLEVEIEADLFKVRITWPTADGSGESAGK